MNLKGRTKRTEHGLESDDAVDEVVEVDFTVAVTVALNQSVERRVTQLKSCNILENVKTGEWRCSRRNTVCTNKDRDRYRERDR